MKESHPDSALIDALGGNAAVVRLCGSQISSPAVSKWRLYGISDGWRMYLTAVRPDVFQKN